MNLNSVIDSVNDVCVSQTGKHLSDLQSAILQGALEGQKYEAIADQNYCTEGHVKDTAAQLWKMLSNAFSERVTKKNVKSILTQQLSLNWQSTDVASSTRAEAERVCDWGDAPELSPFYGRDDEQQQLKHWIVENHCRIVMLRGMGGMGKTTLAVQVAQAVQPKFDALIWRSLRNAPPIQELLADLNRQLCAEASSSSEPFDLISGILTTLRTRRCLIVLDNVESILKSGGSGQYLTGYEGYGSLFKTLGETHHRSCLLLTSREQPQGMMSLEGNDQSMRSLLLTGLSDASGQAVMQSHGCLKGAESDWQHLIHSYGGNPLALKILTAAIWTLCDGEVSAFLEMSAQSVVIFEDIRDLIAQQFNRLGPQEQAIMFWLAIKRERTSIKALIADLFDPHESVLPAVVSLQQRALIEKHGNGFTQQPVVMEYTLARLIDHLYQELRAVGNEGKGDPFGESAHSYTLLRQHSWVQPTAKDYIQDTQHRLLVRPLIDRLIADFGAAHALKTWLHAQLRTLKQKSWQETGYIAGNFLTLLQRLPGDLSGCDLSHLILRQVNFQAVPLHQVDLSYSDITGAIFSEQLGSVLSVIISPQGDRLAAGDMNGQVHVWDFRAGKKLLTLAAHQNWVRAVMFSPDGKSLASAGFDYVVRVWDLETGDCRYTFADHTLGVYSVAFSPDGQTLVSGSADQSIRVWSLETGDCLQQLLGHQDWVNAVAFSPDGACVVSGSGDKTVKLWSLETGECLTTFIGHELGVFAVAFHPTEPFIVSGSADKSLKLWSIEGDRCIRTLRGHRDWVNAVAFSSKGDRIGSGSSDQTIKIWDCETGDCLQTGIGHENTIWSVAFHPEDSILASGSFDQTLKLWDSQSGHCLTTHRGYSNAVWSVAFSANGKSLISGSTDQQVRVWDLEAECCIVKCQGHEAQVSSVDFLQDSSLCVSGSFDHTLKIWDGSTGQLKKELRGHSGGICAIALSPNNHYIASGGFDRSIRIWDISSGNCVRVLPGHDGTVLGLAFAPIAEGQSVSGDRLASCGVDQHIKIWDMESGQCLTTLQGHHSAIWSLAYSPDGCYLASGGVDRKVRLWDMETETCIKTFEGHQDWIFSVVFDPQGKYLASASCDHTIRLWDVKTGDCCHVFEGHASKIYSLAFSPDGKQLASGSHDESIKIWSVEKGSCLQTLKAMKLYEGLNITGVKGLTEAQRLTLKRYGAIEDF